ncbi:MAG TPA: helix-hairpin-helix domain-containing protein, partial [bacterium]|nr:helix-hairpin-helix domain-containing protein [bacterium]
RALKEKGVERSVLDQIPGIGEKRKRILLAQFDSIEEIKRSGIDQLAGLPGMDRATAGHVWNFFHGTLARFNRNK